MLFSSSSLFFLLNRYAQVIYGACEKMTDWHAQEVRVPAKNDIKVRLDIQAKLGFHTGYIT